MTGRDGEDPKSRGLVVSHTFANVTVDKYLLTLPHHVVAVARIAVDVECFCGGKRVLK